MNSELNLESYRINYKITDDYCLLSKVNNNYTWQDVAEQTKKKIVNKRLLDLSSNINCFLF